MSRMLARPFAGVVVLLVCACAPTSPLVRDATLTGPWGGVHVRLELSPAGGTIEYDCAHGTLAGPLRTDDDARFVATGFHVREHGGPIREGEPVDSVPATYLGSVIGDRMTLRVIAGTDTLGPFVLRRSETPQLFKCL